MENNSLEDIRNILTAAKTEIGKVIIGQADIIDKSLIAIFTNNHVLIEGVPGVGKTLLVRTLGKVLDADTNRIQFTPDLMPTDITGTNVFDMREQNFNLVKGPIFTTFLLADEINRAPAKTQSALLQAMQERRVSIDRETHELSANFTVFATQNPVEYEGTYPLPEAQKDRFMFTVTMDCPSRDNELTLAQRTLGPESPEAVLDRGGVETVITAEHLKSLRSALDLITVKEELVTYAVDLVRATRTHAGILVGAGPRATQALLLAARAQAAMGGRDFVTPDDIRSLARPVLHHRLLLRAEFEIEGLTNSEVIEMILKEVAVPT